MHVIPASKVRGSSPSRKTVLPVTPALKLEDESTHFRCKTLKRKNNDDGASVPNRKRNVKTLVKTDYVIEFKRIIKEGEYLPEQVFNAAEMTLFWKKMPGQTYISRNERCAPGFKASKDRLTILLCANARGDCIIMPMLLYHSFNPRALKNKDKDNMSVFWRFNTNSWLNRCIFREWFHQCFVPGVEGYLTSKQLPFKALLLLDNAPTHPRDLTHSYPNIKVEFLPPQMVPILQPLTDAFKRYYTMCTFRRILNAVKSDPEGDLDKCWKEYNIAHCIENIREAIDEVTESTINACWKKLWSEVVNDFSMLPDVEEEVRRILRLAWQFGGEGFVDMKHTEVEELLASHNVQLTNEEVEEMQKIEIVDSNSDSKADTLNLENLSELRNDLTSITDRIFAMDPVKQRSLEFKKGMEVLCRPYNELYKRLRQSAKGEPIPRFYQVKKSCTSITPFNTSKSITSTTTTEAKATVTTSRA